MNSENSKLSKVLNDKSNLTESVLFAMNRTRENVFLEAATIVYS